MDSVDRARTVSVGNLDLPPGYYAERGATGVYLMDPDGRRVMRFSSDAASAGDPRETGRLKPSAKPGPEDWQELCRSLLLRLSQKSTECERLCARDGAWQAARRIGGGARSGQRHSGVSVRVLPKPRPGSRGSQENVRKARVSLSAQKTATAGRSKSAGGAAMQTQLRPHGGDRSIDRLGQQRRGPSNRRGNRQFYRCSGFAPEIGYPIGKHDAW
jgi:hypothetical protein